MALCGAHSAHKNTFEKLNTKTILIHKQQGKEEKTYTFDFGVNCHFKENYWILQEFDS